MGKILGGGGGKSVSQSGIKALPKDIQKQYQNILSPVQDVLGAPEQYFSPMGLTQNESLVGDILSSAFTNPEAYSKQIQNFLNPYRDIVISDINKQFESPQGALAAQISEAGAFGGSRARGAQSDLERARLDAISNALSGQYNTAVGQMQQGLQGLLGFGGFERGLDLQQRQALPSALDFASSIYAPLLGASTSIQKGGSGGIGGVLGGVGGTLSGLGAIGAFSDERLKKNIKKIGKLDNGLNVYYFEYKGSETPHIGVMAQDVEKVMPDAVFDVEGFKAVNLKAVANGVN